MQSVIAEYASETEAARAVRSLEGQHSIQDIVIADLGKKIWRRRRTAEGRNFSSKARFVVLMRGAPEEIARARQSLS
jgi:hypothetical protein